ncbi:cobalamin-dependent protein, partial [bacterium]|nr:cobalamin-dependent protein [bacterium]
MKIVLATINARYSHTSFGLRYLKANLNEYEQQTEICEFSLDESVQEIAEKIIVKNPDIIGFGCYIWNIEAILKAVEIVKAILPNALVVLGGPEVSYENGEFLPYCNYLIEGEGELALYELVKAYDNGCLPPEKILKKNVCDLSQIKMPYYLYSDEDIANRLIYVEATRGCPFSCEFCLSSLSNGVREFDLDM